MDFHLIDTLLSWVGAHPAWAGGVVMLIAFFESLALVGLFLPGAVLMFGVGALVGADTLPLWPTLAWAALGAIGGDGVSFWLGKHYHQRIRTIWPLRSHPELLAQATNFFYLHGGKSIVLGRFIGPIRPVIPLVAGMLEMPTRRFIPVNVISGLLWAPVYVLPGMVFAATLGIAAEVATRLALLLGTLLMLLFLVLWLTRRLFNLYHRHTYPLLRWALAWGERHPRLGRLPAALLDPQHSEARALTLLGLLLLCAGVTLLWVLQAMGGILPNLDEMVGNALAALRTPWGDPILLNLAALGDRVVLAALFTAVLGWLAWRRHLHAVLLWLSAALFALLFSALPGLLFAAVSGATPIIYAAVLYGFLAVLLGHEVDERWRWLIYGAAALLLSAIAFALLYFAMQRLSEVLAGLSLGLLWVALLGIGYLRHGGSRPATRPLLLVALLSLAAAGVWYHAARFDTELARYAPRYPQRTLAINAWQRSGWAQLPAERGDVRGRRRQPLTLQYAGALAPLQQALARQGWRPAVNANAVNWLQWLSQRPVLARLPVLPQVHAGHRQRLLLLKVEGGKVLALRLWPGDAVLQPGATPLWLGNVAYLGPMTILGTFTVPRTLSDFVAPRRVLQHDLKLAGWSPQPQRRSTGGTVLLLRAPSHE